MKRSFAILLCGTAVAATALPACLACNDIGCAGGFEWTARAADEGALTPGTYEVSIALEDDRYTLTCEIGDTFGESDCTEPAHVEGDVDYSVSFSITQLDETEWDPEQPVGGFFMVAVDTSESGRDGLFSANRGPTQVTIEVSDMAGPLIDESYDVEYERDDDYRGDPRCGYCDLTEERTATW
jgi:hypothetical protein